jgi:hypothetical protein
MRKSDLLLVTFLFFMLGIGSRYSFAGCTSELDTHGNSCRDSTNCGNPCNGVIDDGDGGIQPLAGADTLPVVPNPNSSGSATQSPSTGISLSWLNIQGLLMYRRPPVAARVDRVSYLDTWQLGFARGQA